MKILVVLTGGTIGSSNFDGWISPNESNNLRLVDYYTKEIDGSVSFDVTNPYTILSENLSANELSILTKTVEDNLNKDFDGVIISHGTDTLLFTANAVDQCFESTNIPIVFVSSNYPLDDKRANGYANFVGAVDFIKRGISGTYISYKNEKDTDIIEASKALLHLEMSDKIYSADCDISKEKAENLGAIDFIENPKILVIDMLPTICNYNLDDVNAVILKPYHSGTINTVSKSLKAICKNAIKKGIPVYLADGMNEFDYESKKLFDEYGIISKTNSTFSSLYIKIWISLSKKE